MPEKNQPEFRKTLNVLSHEIRNVLANFTNAAYLLRQQVGKMDIVEQKDKSLHYLAILDRGIANMNGMVQDILDFSTARLPSLSLVDINEACAQAIEELKKPEKASVALSKAEPAILDIDKEEVKRAVKAVVKNSFQSVGDNDPVQVSVNLKKSDDVFSIEIADNGPGMDSDTLSKAGEPFFTTKSKGMGLGLAVTKRIIEERHKGRLEISSEAGKGVRVVMKLPLKKEGD